MQHDVGVARETRREGHRMLKHHFHGLSRALEDFLFSLSPNVRTFWVVSHEGCRFDGLGLDKHIVSRRPLARLPLIVVVVHCYGMMQQGDASTLRQHVFSMGASIAIIFRRDDFSVVRGGFLHEINSLLLADRHLCHKEPAGDDILPSGRRRFEVGLYLGE